MDGILKVTPNVLTAKASEFDSTRQAIMALIDQMTQQVNSLSAVWEGEASTAFKTAYNGLSDDIERINSMISEHVRDLNEIASRYAESDNASIGNIESLPSDAVQ